MTVNNKTETHKYREQTMVTSGEGEREEARQEYGIERYKLLYIYVCIYIYIYIHTHTHTYMYAKWMYYTAQGKYSHYFVITLNEVYSIKY